LEVGRQDTEKKTHGGDTNRDAENSVHIPPFGLKF